MFSTMPVWIQVGLGVSTFFAAIVSVAIVIRVLARPAPKPIQAPRCDTCVHWDLQKGQHVLKLHPYAAMAYQNISPSQSMQKFDEEGKLIETFDIEPRDDSFENLGACNEDQKLHLCCDKCPKWLSKELTK